jgi:hypothetical protein
MDTRRGGIFLSAAAFAVVLLGGVEARAQEGWAQQPIMNPPPPDIVRGSTWRGTHGTAARLGPQLGIRAGYSAGTGIVYSGLDVSDASNGAIPVTVDLGWRFRPWIYAGLYGSFAHVFTKNNPVSCPGNFDCNSQDWRFGAEVDFHYLPHSALDPYVGLGSGYEILHTNVNGQVPVPTLAGPMTGFASAGIIDRGWEFLNLTLGFDARIADWVGVGPYVSASLNQYNVHTGTQSVTVAGMQVQNVPSPDVQHGLHELFTAGVRGTFNP